MSYDLSDVTSSISPLCADDSPKDVRYHGPIFFDNFHHNNNSEKSIHPNGLNNNTNTRESSTPTPLVQKPSSSSFAIRNHPTTNTNRKLINGVYKSTFTLQDFWSRYYMLSDFQHHRGSSKNNNDDINCPPISDDEKWMFHFKRLISNIAIQLWDMEQHQEIDEPPHDVNDEEDEDQPFDVPSDNKKNRTNAPTTTKLASPGRYELSMKPKPNSDINVPRFATTKSNVDEDDDDDEVEEDFASLNFSSRCALVGLQLGKTKVFIRREAYERIEYLRYHKMVTAAIFLQDVLYYNTRKQYPVRSQYAIRKLQTWIRRRNNTKNQSLSVENTILDGEGKSPILVACSAIKIQRAWRFYTIVKLTKQTETRRWDAAVTIQSAYRKKWDLTDKSRVFRQRTTGSSDADDGREHNVTVAVTTNHRSTDSGESEVLPTNHSNDKPLEPKGLIIERQSSNSTSIQSSPSMTGTITIDNDKMLVDLFREIDNENWGMVTAMIGKFPILVQSNDIKTGENILHKVVRHSHVWPELLKLMIAIHPNGLSQVDSMGALPIHHAAAFDNVNEFKIVVDAYPDGMFFFDKMGRLPIHVAATYDAVETMKFILSQNSEVALSKIRKPKGGGGLPIHVACANNASLDVISALIAAAVSAIKLPDENGDLPLHLLLRCGEVADIAVVNALVTCFPGVLSRTDSYGNLPLAIAIKCQCTYPIIKGILTKYPEAARILNANHQSPLVLAFQNRADDRTILALLQEAPELATAIDDQTGLLPIQIATEYEHSHYIVHSLLMRDLPIDLNEKVRARLVPHHFSWNHLVSNTDDLYHQVVAQLLKICTQPQVLALAHIEGPDGKSALFSGTTICKHEIRVMLRLFGTLEVMNERPAYSNPENGTQIFYALRYDPPPQQNTNISATFSVLHESTYKKGTGAPDDYLEDYDDNSYVSTASRNSIRSTLTARSYQTMEDRMRHIKNEKGQHVIAKLTPRSDVVERELKVRKGYHLSRHYIPAVISVHHTVQHAAYYEAMAESGYCITMEGADATAENQLGMLRKADRRALTKILKRVAVALLHMHDHGLIHTDFGAHNVGKFGSRWKLLSVGGSVPIGGDTDPNRGMFHPPEAVHIESKRAPIVVGRKHGKASVVSIKAHPTYDIWSFGAFIYQIVAGMPLGPYVGRDKVALSQQALSKVGYWDENSLKKDLSQIAEEDIAYDLIKHMLHHDPKMRLRSMRKVLEHPFFNESKSVKNSSTKVEGMSSDSTARKLSSESTPPSASKKNGTHGNRMSSSTITSSTPKTGKKLQSEEFQENRDGFSSDGSDSGLPESSKKSRWSTGSGRKKSSNVEARILI